METREDYLQRVIAYVRPWFDNIDAPIPSRVFVSVGYAKGARPNAIGWCYSSNASEDVNHLFISPELNDSHKVIATLIHELCHAADNCESGHTGNFRRIAFAVGLEGKMTATVAGEDLRADISKMITELGEFRTRR